MSTFIVRVQLTRESTGLYTILRDHLLAIGFTKRLKSQQGIEYRLPNGNYLIDSDRDIDTISKAVKKVALAIDRTAMILVTESKNNEWIGLQKC